MSEWSEALTREIAEQVVELLRPELEQLPASAPADEPWRLLTRQEAAKMLGRSERQVQAWSSSGELSWVRLDGGRAMYDPDDVRAFARSRVVGEVLADRFQPSRKAAPLRAIDSPSPVVNRRVGS